MLWMTKFLVLFLAFAYWKNAYTGHTFPASTVSQPVPGVTFTHTFQKSSFCKDRTSPSSGCCRAGLAFILRGGNDCHESQEDSSDDPGSSSLTTFSSDDLANASVDIEIAESEEMRSDEEHFKHRRPRTRFTEEELTEIQNLWENDTHWANVSLCPLAFGEETEDEIQWEMERLHGNLNEFRRTGEPTQTFLAWKAEDDKRKLEDERIRLANMQTADEIEVSSEFWSEDEPSWFISPTGDTMWRPLNGSQYIKYSDDPCVSSSICSLASLPWLV